MSAAAEHAAATPPADFTAGDRTLNPYGQRARTALHSHTDDRKLVRPANPDAIYGDVWTTTVDLRTGLSVNVRRADCGAGCRCAAEVRVTPRRATR